jgi:hypothetical protein
MMERNKRMRINGKGLWPRILWFCSLFLAAFGASAQTAGENPAPDSLVVAMTFMGDDAEISGVFHESVIREVDNLGGYKTQEVSATRFPETLNFPPDQPPDPVYLGDSRHVLTGEYYVDMDDLQHFQLWLWNSANGSLVYTDEMVFEDMEEADAYLPPMVRWIFSQIPTTRINVVEVDPGTETVVETVSDTGNSGEGETRSQPYMRRFYLGLRGGGFLNSTMPQTSGNYEGGVSQGFSGEGAIVAEFRIFRFLSLQAEGIFMYDTFKAAKKVESGTDLIRSTDIFRSLSLMFPLYIKAPLEIGNFTLSPFVGVYYTMPLGSMIIIPGNSDEVRGVYTYIIDPFLGISLGIDVGLPLGPGEIFAGLRFDRNLGLTKVRTPDRMEYGRHRIGLSFGYKFLIWKSR